MGDIGKRKENGHANRVAICHHPAALRRAALVPSWLLVYMAGDGISLPQPPIFIVISYKYKQTFS
jgi:hypothetical protein